MLSQIRTERMWEAGWDSQEEYEMELKMSPATISRLVRIYEIFHLQYGIPENKLAEAGGYTVVSEYLPMLKEGTTKKEVEDWFGEAAQLTRADIRRAIIEKRKGVDMAICKHENAYTLFVCPDCGERHRIEHE